MVTKCKTCVYHKFDETWRIFVESINWIINDKPGTHAHARPLVIKLTPVIVDSFKTIFSSEVTAEHGPVLSEKIQASLYVLLRKMLGATSVSEGLHGISNPIKLLTEERTVFDFIEYLPTIFNKPELYHTYFNFLLEFLNFRVENPHSDAFIRRVLGIIKNSVVVHNLGLELVKGLVPKLYPKFATIISLRFQNDACKMLLFNAKDSQPLWYEVGEFFVNISTFLVSPKMYKEVAEAGVEEPVVKVAETEETAAGNANVAAVVSSENFAKRTAEILNDKELQEVAWSHVIKLLKEILKVSDSALNLLDKGLAEEVIKKSQDLDITLINFILKVLLPSSGNLPKESQQELINLIDHGCTAFNTTFSNTSTHSRSGGDTLSKFCISTLIGLCSSTESTAEEFISVKQKIATITTPVLINRCKAIFHKYMADEKRSGQVPLPKFDFS